MSYGRLITFEGPDTAGKSTVINKLKTALPLIYPNETFLFTREPGNLLNYDYNESEKIRKELLSNGSLTVREQAELFAKSRLYHTKDIIKQLERGYNVITDRYLFSSILYQGSDLGFKEVLDINKESLKILEDNEIEIDNIIMQISEETYNKRMANKEKDALENVERYKVLNRILYHQLANKVNKDLNNKLGNIYIVDANLKEEDVIMETLNHIHKIIR